MSFHSTKTFGHEVGLSVCFRQHAATHSHCSKLHGYAIAVKLTFGCSELDDRNWVMDFGGLKEVKKFLTGTFDHKCILAIDDPHLHYFRSMHDVGLVDLVILPAVGCEYFAQYIHDWIDHWLHKDHGMREPRVWIEQVEVMEHGANSAIYKKD